MTTPSASEYFQFDKEDAPAAIVSPFLLNKILPISLLVANVSIGIDPALAVGLDNVADRNVT